MAASRDARASKGTSDTGPTLRDRQRELTRTLILEAAQKVFADRGYVQTRVEDITAAAGTTRATFYLHFPGKSELAQALFQQTVDLAVERYQKLDQMLAERQVDPRQALRTWLAEWLEVWRENAAAYMGMAQAAAVDPEVAEVQLGMSPRILDELKHAPWNRAVGIDEQARQRALMLEIMTQRMFSLLSLEWLKIPDDVALDFLTDLWSDVFDVEDWSQDD
jgi:AcrR family transcriptional regulator